MKNDFNILFIVIDALRARNLGCYGYNKSISPNIDRLAKESLLFENAYSCTNATDSSLTSIFSGRHPLSHGIISHFKYVDENSLKYFIASGTKLLPEILKQKGYKTLAIDWLGRWHKRGYDYYSGAVARSKLYRIKRRLFRSSFDRYLRLLSRSYAHYIKSSLDKNALEITYQAMKLIKKNRNKFFLFLHYWDLHMPYAPPTRYFNSNKGIQNHINSTFLDQITINKVLRPSNYSRYPPNYYVPTDRITQEHIQRYEATIRYIDDQIGKLINFLEKNHLTEKMLIIITSDHGESLIEHGIYFDHHGLYDVSIHVPLIMNYTWFPKGKRIKGMVQHIDIMPTLLEMISKTSEKYNMDGKSFLSIIFGEQEDFHKVILAFEELVQRRAAIRTENYKYIFAPTKNKTLCRYCKRIHNRNEELYDLKRDPNELKNISYQTPDLKNELKEKLVNWLENFEFYRTFVKEQPSTSETHILDEQDEIIMKKLQDLGYI
ncbi:MAG: sulfatase [Promethearchaeota archaeon]